MVMVFSAVPQAWNWRRPHYTAYAVSSALG